MRLWPIALSSWVLCLAGCHAPSARPAAATRRQLPRRTPSLRSFIRQFHVIYGEGLRGHASPEAALARRLKHPTARYRELPLLRRAYTGEGARLRFVDGRGLNEAGAVVADRLGNAELEGLDPRRLGVTRLRAAREALDRATRPGCPSPPRRAAELRVLREAATGAQPGLPEPELHQLLLAKAIQPRRGIPRLARAFARDVARQQALVRRAAELELALADGFLSYARELGGGLEKLGELLLTRDDRPGPATAPASRPTSRPTRNRKTLAPRAYLQRALERALHSIVDRKSARRALERLAPHPQYRRLQAALARYRTIVASGGWKQVKPRRGLRPGRRGPGAAALRRRLAAEGYLDGARSDDRYGAGLTAAVRDYQRTHQLQVTGRPHRSFWRSLDVPAERRLAAIRITLRRWRESAAGRTPYYVLVNIPDFHVEVWRGSRRVLRDRVIVGRSQETRCDEETRVEVPAFATPRQSAWLRSLVFSPYWNVTRDIKESELDLERGKDPFFYEKHGYEVMEPGKRGEWVREMPGPKNSLGFVKFLFPNPHETYLHGTPHRSQFNRPVRAYSHGCMRVEHPRPLARLLLRSDGQWDERRYGQLYKRWESMDFTPLLKEWDPELYERLRKRAEKLETRVELRRPVPIHVEYFTVRVDDDGAVHFLTDIYGLDEQRLNPRPPRSCTPESELAKRNVAVMTKRVEELERQALFLGPCALAAAAILRTLDPERSWKVRRRIKRLEQLQRFTRAHANLAKVVREAHRELLAARGNRRGRWRDRLVRKAVRVHRLLQGLEKLTRATQTQCKQLTGR